MMSIETPSSIFKRTRKSGESATTEGLFRQFVEATPLGIVVIDSEAAITYVNESLCTCFGYTADELLGQPIEMLVPESLKDEHVLLRDGYIASPRQRLMQGAEVRGRRKDGTEVPVAIGLNPLIQGETVKVVCTVLDRSESLGANDTLASFFDLSLDLFCIANMQGYFLRVNSNFPRLLGYSEEELLNRPFVDFVHPADLAATQAAMARLAAGRPVIRFRNRYRTAKGSYVCLDWNARVGLVNETIFAVARDITEDLRLQEIQEQLKLAIEFQRKLYPLNMPTVKGLDLSGAAVSAAPLCGDYYDFIVTNEGRLVIAVGDVSGHGLGPALAMVEVRSILRGILHYRARCDLSEMIEKLNELLLEDLPEARFVSLLLMEIDLERRRLRYAGAGHQAMVFRANGQVEILESTCPVLGLLDSIKAKTVPPVRLDAGDVVFICTDGVTEACNARFELFGLARVSACVSQHRQSSSSEIIQRLFAQVRQFSQGQGLDDDMTVVVAKSLAT